ncbi:MAG: hypothetical protein FJW40_21840 [Acidobacteria bacterium]|nr:hypothetical protein [Acidobacteriota bacterium]
MKRFVACLMLAALGQAPAQTQAQAPDKDAVLAAMTDEMARLKSLRLDNVDRPYFAEYAMDEARGFSLTASLGGLMSERETGFRVPRVRVRVGDYKFDNTNHVYSDYSFGARYDSDSLPLDNDYAAIREHLWLATDRAYKSAVAAIGRKRAALRNVNVNEQLNDFARAEPVTLHLPLNPARLDRAEWRRRVVEISRIFADYPELRSSSVDFEFADGSTYLVNSEGASVRYPDRLVYYRARAAAQAPDGMVLRDHVVLPTLDPLKLPPEADLRRATTRVAENVRALLKAPVARDSYSGPVLFEGEASPQLFAQLLALQLNGSRQPVSEPGRPAPVPASELWGRIGSRVLPEWMDVMDDPTQKEYRGRALYGNYVVDFEGVAPKPVPVVEKGILKSYLLTRQPVRGFEGSNGHARLPGNFGASTAYPSNFFVRAGERVSAAALKTKLMDFVKQRDLPFGVIVRRLDFPSSAGGEELQRIVAGASQSGSSRPVSLPILVYRVYPDGREELVRGWRFRGLNSRSLRDIAAASEDEHVFDFVGNLALFALMDAGGYVTGCSIVAPSVLIEDIELEKPQDELPKIPVVPPPPLVSQR